MDAAVVGLSSSPFLTALTLLGPGRASLYLLAAIAASLAFLYHLLTVAIAGRTSGMALLKLRIVDAESRSAPPTWRQAGRRALGATIALVLPPLNLPVIWLSRSRRSLSDHLSGTVVAQQ
jgi:uncharacterized RDD family membrane protein YckC